MISAYLNAAMRQAKYELLEDGTFYGEIPVCPGVYANTTSLEICREELTEVVEEWVLLRVSKNLSLPVIDGIALVIKEVA